MKQVSLLVMTHGTSVTTWQCGHHRHLPTNIWSIVGRMFIRTLSCYILLMGKNQIISLGDSYSPVRSGSFLCLIIYTNGQRSGSQYGRRGADFPPELFYGVLCQDMCAIGFETSYICSCWCLSIKRHAKWLNEGQKIFHVIKCRERNLRHS